MLSINFSLTDMIFNLIVLAFVVTVFTIYWKFVVNREYKREHSPDDTLSTTIKEEAAIATHDFNTEKTDAAINTLDSLTPTDRKRRKSTTKKSATKK